MKMSKTGSDSQFEKKTKKVRAAIYVRCATPEASKASRKRQERACLSYAQSLWAGKPLVVADAAAGSSVQDRPELSALLDKCRGGEVDVLVVEDFDRLARSAMGGAEIIDRLSKAGVKIHSATERRELGPLDGLLTNRVRKRGMSARKARGKAGAKKPPAEE
jgi:DNA invertase Pin-like site-specific DNA recombinase